MFEDPACRDMQQRKVRLILNTSHLYLYSLLLLHNNSEFLRFVSA
jgi:hypothetical protein